MQCCEDKMAEKNLNFKDFLANADLFGYSLTITCGDRSTAFPQKARRTYQRKS